MVASAPHQIAVVGAGPAGLMAAETLATHGQRVTVFDRMASPARKFLLAGRGGLNLTHSEPLETFLTRYGVRAPALAPMIAAHTPADVIAWAEALGQHTFVGTSGRVFPRAMKATPLLRAWLRRLKSQGVTFRMQHTWTGWSELGRPTFLAPGASESAFDCDALVLALGGASWPRLGADGSWRTAFEANRIPLNPLTPSNCGLCIAWSEHILQRFVGDPLKRIAIRHEGDEHRGEVVLTRYGLEGGAVYPLSSKLAARTATGARVIVHIDLKPDEPLDFVARHLQRPKGKESTSNWLRKCLKLAPVAIALLRESRRILPADPLALARLVKALPLTITGVAGLERAISTAGGVPLEVLNEHLMLQVRPGTFLAGEMLDWDAPTGGYLLQASLATGVAAARGVLQFLEGASR